MAVGVCTGCNHLFIVADDEASMLSCPRCDEPMRRCEREELLNRVRIMEGRERESEPHEEKRSTGAPPVSPAGLKVRGEVSTGEWMTGQLVVRCQTLLGEAQHGRGELKDRLRQCRELRGELHRLIEELRASVRPPAAQDR